MFIISFCFTLCIEYIFLLLLYPHKNINSIAIIYIIIGVILNSPNIYPSIRFENGAYIAGKTIIVLIYLFLIIIFAPVNKITLNISKPIIIKSIANIIVLLHNMQYFI
ncbi:hypothetical protein SDC9_211623 [bioreactor metagenome]|uniref:Uncharacterized protein n=1 Tax=bioreactor metagenome TaxID=1076179 RepID=A0A645JKB0_9ZZZZ